MAQVRSGQLLLQLCRSRCSITRLWHHKGKAVTEISSMLDINLSDVMMVGDGHNDLDALQV